MPIYQMVCDNCNHTFEITKGYHDPLPKRCPKCRKHKLYQDYSLSYASVVKEPTTLGQLAERNNKKAGKELTQKELEKHPKFKKKRKGPWYNSDNKDLSTALHDVNTPAKQKKYILEGKR